MSGWQRIPVLVLLLPRLTLGVHSRGRWETSSDSASPPLPFFKLIGHVPGSKCCNTRQGSRRISELGSQGSFQLALVTWQQKDHLLDRKHKGHLSYFVQHIRDGKEFWTSTVSLLPREQQQPLPISFHWRSESPVLRCKRGSYAWWVSALTTEPHTICASSTEYLQVMLINMPLPYRWADLAQSIPTHVWHWGDQRHPAEHPFCLALTSPLMAASDKGWVWYEQWWQP